MPGERTALVTGASRGIGRAVVETLVANGRRVVACARDAARLAELEQTHGSRVVALALDLSQPGAAVAAVDEAERLLGPLTELVYAAGVVDYARVGEVGEAALAAQLALNFVAPFAMLQHAGTRMQARGEGALVAVTSTLAERPAPLTSAYAASKAALTSALRSFALELAPAVRVNAVAPGVVDTDMVRVPRRALGAGQAREQAVAEQLERLRALHPLARLGTARDVAEAVLYVLNAPWLTGSVLTIDGGLTLA